MILTLIAKKREHEGKKWINFSLIKNEKWYNVKFVKNCIPPKAHTVTEGVGRAFIELTETNKFDIVEKEQSVIFIEDFNELNTEALKAEIENERKKIEAYREKRERSKMNFLMPIKDEELPF